MRKLFAFLALWFVLGLLVAGCLLAGGGRADGQVAICNPDAYGGINWRFVECTHQLHGHEQWHGGQGTNRQHDIAHYRDEAAAYRRFLRAHR